MKLSVENDNKQKLNGEIRLHVSIEDLIGLMIRFLNSRRKKPATSAQTIQNQIENLLNNVDLELLMETYDTVVTSSKQLKPLINKITPFFRKFK